MSENNQVMTRSDYSREQMKIIKATVAKQTSMEQFLFFIEVCKHTGLSPFARQIYAVVRGGSDITIQVSIDGYRVLAERTGKYAGQIGPEWCDESGEWKDVWLSSKPPVAARVGVLRRDFDKPIWGVARYAAYEQASSPLWRKMPDVMLAKCAESLALRKAFPAQLSGLYTSDEMAQADHQPSMPVVTTVETSPDDELVSGEVVDATQSDSEVSHNGTSPATSQAAETPPVPASEYKPATTTVLAMLAKAIKRANALGLDWHTLTHEVTGMVKADEELTLPEIAKINGEITKREKQAA